MLYCALNFHQRVLKVTPVHGHGTSRLFLHMLRDFNPRPCRDVHTTNVVLFVSPAGEKKPGKVVASFSVESLLRIGAGRNANVNADIIVVEIACKQRDRNTFPLLSFGVAILMENP